MNETRTNLLEVSVFMPYFNAERTIRHAILSALFGSLPPKKLIIVDDGSRPESSSALERIIDEIASPKVRVISHSRNRGGGAARNTACEAANSEWLFCLDSDNLMSHRLLEELARVAQNSEISNLSVAPQNLVYFTGETGRISHLWDFRRAEITREHILRSASNPNSGGNYLFSKASFEIAGGYPTLLGSLDTFGFGFRQVLSGGRMLIAPGARYFHRLSQDSYWMRESAKSGAIRSQRAKSLILESAEFISPKEMRRLFLRSNQAKWFDNLGKGRARKSGATVVSGVAIPLEAFEAWQSELSGLLNA